VNDGDQLLKPSGHFRRQERLGFESQNLNILLLRKGEKAWKTEKALADWARDQILGWAVVHNGGPLGERYSRN